MSYLDYKSLDSVVFNITKEKISSIEYYPIDSGLSNIISFRIITDKNIYIGTFDYDLLYYPIDMEEYIINCIIQTLKGKKINE